MSPELLVAIHGEKPTMKMWCLRMARDTLRELKEHSKDIQAALPVQLRPRNMVVQRPPSMAALRVLAIQAALPTLTEFDGRSGGGESTASFSVQSCQLN